MSNLCILLHTKIMPDFVSSPANFCHPLLSFVGYFDVFPKARTHRPIFTVSSEELTVESADSTAESVNSTSDSVIVGRLALSNMFNILSPLESANGNRSTIRVGRREIGTVGTGL